MLMGRRACPLCFVRVPWTTALVHSYDIECPACHTPLELSRFTRIVGAFSGLAGAFLAVHLARGIFHWSFWLTPILATFFAFGFMSALGVLIAGDLVVRREPTSTGFPHA